MRSIVLLIAVLLRFLLVAVVLIAVLLRFLLVAVLLLCLLLIAGHRTRPLAVCGFPVR